MSETKSDKANKADTIQILSITPGSDGDGRKWPKHSYERNDPYFCEKLAEMWIKDLPGGPQAGVKYQLDKLPQGYAGFEKTRGDGNHVDRYLYGHPNGQFRSLNECYPHFKHLMDTGDAAGCPCKLCLGGRSKARVSGSGGHDVSQPRATRPKTTTQPLLAQDRIDLSGVENGSVKRKNLSDSDGPIAKQRKLTDAEGTHDIYEDMIEKLREAGPNTTIDEPTEERMSPDWRTSNADSIAVLREWKSLPRYVPRIGELVLFTRLAEDQKLVWSGDHGTFRISGNDLTAPVWQAGVVTQMPEEPILDQDLIDDSTKAQGVNISGFRIEPMPQPGSDHKAETKQYTYVPLHLIRPLSLLPQCVGTKNPEDLPASIRHALTVASSFCVVGKHRFKGRWPSLTVFALGVYIGGELIMPGDTVRLLPRKDDPQDAVTDVMVVTSVRLLFVNLDAEELGILGHLSDTPYQTCLHVSGRVYTLDPTKSFDGIGKVSIDPGANILPPGLAKYGNWYHYHDPAQDKLRVELPYHRILGRCLEYTAIDAWFSTPSKRVPNKSEVWVKDYLTLGMHAVEAARAYSIEHDKRIPGGRSWFWADTRIEQLDLHDVNNRAVGTKDTSRTKGQMIKWRTSLKAMDGKKGAQEALQHVKMKENAKEVAKVQGTSYGMVAASAPIEAGTDTGTDGGRTWNDREQSWHDGHTRETTFEPRTRSNGRERRRST